MNLTPKKPKTNAEKIDMLWDAAFNHLPHQINILRTRQNLILLAIGGSTAILSVVIALVKLFGS